jgi:predicted lysophospholipase L1 biosynthesis ABC-type transport system permease subunit
MARRQWPGRSPLGQRITIEDPTDDPAWLTVVGVVRNAARYDWTAAPADEMYLPYLQQEHYLSGEHAALSYMTLVAHGPVAPDALIADVRREVAALDRDVPVTEAQTMERVVEAANAEPRFYLAVLAAFAAMALVLAGIGIYGVMSYAVSQRTREIGVRITLGASRHEVLGLVLRRGMAVALAGAGAGLVAALGLARLMESMLFGVEPLDPLTFVLVPLLLAVVAFGANAIPALRAARVDPVEALRRD